MPLLSSKPLLLGQPMPNWDCETSSGPLNFHKYIDGSWAILFSHPDDFTPVCTTELGTVAQLMPEFQKRGVKVVALSCNSAESHKAWAKDVLAYAKLDASELPYPIIADSSRVIADRLAMIDHTQSSGMPMTCRAVFIIAPDKTLKLQIMYPASTGRSFGEILRVIDSLQRTATYKIATPVDWAPGDNVIVLNSVSDTDARDLFPNFVTEKLPSGKPYLRTTADPATPSVFKGWFGF